MGVKMGVKMEVMRYAQDDSLAYRKHLSSSKASLLPWARPINFLFYFIL
jgi:hypothetical protein